MPTQLTLRCVRELLDKDFFVPAYQRGYRWTPRQVRELLGDLYDFMKSVHRREQHPQAFYCLQPIVVTPRGEGERWELIDGQQRLTTLFLILSAAKQIVEILGCTPYTLQYETRPRSMEFLIKPDEAAANQNIDFFHMWQARQTIVEWFDSPQVKPDKIKFVDFLLTAQGNNPRIIWYELPADEDPIDVFVRLNVGRIPLTNSELIRALFLREQNFTNPLHKIQIAHEWDQLEKLLREDGFWHFLNGAAPDSPTRIELLFAIDALLDDIPIASDDPYGVFLAFLPDEADAMVDWLRRWRKVKQIAMRLQEWYEDRVFFHLVGMWLHLQTSGKDACPAAEVVVDLLRTRPTMGRSAFLRHLKEKIASSLLGVALDSGDKLDEQVQTFLDNLSYGSDTRRIRNTLLLFNVATITINPTAFVRFPFDRFHNESWDIEHIRSVSEYRPGRADGQKQWLGYVAAYWAIEPPASRYAPLVAAVDALREDFSTQAFEAVYAKVLEAFGEHNPSDTDNSIGNLTLLDAGTNRGYGNAPFPVKRRKVLKLDQSGTFVPLCTTNAFLKYYSPREAGLMYWTETDADAHAEAVHAVLVSFFGGDQ